MNRMHRFGQKPREIHAELKTSSNMGMDFLTTSLRKAMKVSIAMTKKVECIEGKDTFDCW